MATQEKSTTTTTKSKMSPPEPLSPDATEDQVREFDRQRIEYEQWVADSQKEAAETSPQTKSAP